MALNEKPKGWWQRGWDDIRPNLLWSLLQLIFGGGIISACYAFARKVSDESVSWFEVFFVFAGSFLLFLLVSVFAKSRQDRRYGKLKGAFTAMIAYLPILLGLGVCVWAYSVGTTLARIDRETHALRSNLDLYFKPRSISEEQIATLAAALGKVDSQDVAILVHANDAEASAYMGQIASGLYRGGWKINRTAYTSEQMNQGISINVEYTGQPVNPDPKHPRPDELLRCALDEAKIMVNGSGAAFNRPAYMITIVIGPRALVIDSAPPPPRPQIPPPPGWQ